MAGTSTLDRRRINAPETIQPTFLSTTTPKRKQRSGSERQGVHSLFIQTGLVAQASGSAYIESNSVKVACSVFGPRQQTQQNRSQSSSSTVGGGSASKSYTNEAELMVDCRFASFSTNLRKKSGKDTESISLANSIRLAILPSIRLDKLPKASLDVFITILQADAGRGQGKFDDEACAAAAVTVASCALANAGIELYGLVVGIHGVWGNEGGMIVDATHAEAVKAKSSLTLWSMPALGTITSIDQTGHMSIEEMEKLLTLLQTASATVHLKAAKAIQDGFKQRHLSES